MTAIVTKESLQRMLDNSDNDRRMHIVGRALVVLFNRQTEAEQSNNDTENLNGIGFTGADGRSGCLTAKTYLKYRSLQDWQVEKWLKRDKNGFARLVKYHKQLNEAAEAKKAVSA